MINKSERNGSDLLSGKEPEPKLDCGPFKGARIRRLTQIRTVAIHTIQPAFRLTDSSPEASRIITEKNVRNRGQEDKGLGLG